MKLEAKAKTLLRKIIKKAYLDPKIKIVVRVDGERINENFTVNEIIESVFAVDISTVKFLDSEKKKCIGWLFIVLDYESEPEEIICDYSDNEYTGNLLKEFINYRR